MIKSLYFIIIILMVILSNSASVFALEEFDITTLDNPAPGYLFMGPVSDSVIAIFDNSGRPAYQKAVNRSVGAFNALRILENGKFAFFATTIEKWYIVDENLDITDSVAATEPYSTNFHTLHVSPQGHYLLLATDTQTVNLVGKVPNGKPNAMLYNLVIQEFDAQKNLVFQWDCYQHIDVQQATADIDLSNDYLDPYHINQVIYDTDGNILINFRDLDAIYKVNRSNGNIMWVWGGSAARRNDFTYLNDSQDGFYGFSHQHDPKRLANGNILLFDNGNLKMRPISRAVEYQIDETAHTVKKVWEYYHTDSLFADFMGNAQRLPNGNTLIGWGANSMNHFLVVNTEVTPGGTKAFESQQLVAQGIYQSLRFVYKMDAVGLNINSSGNYDFNDTKNKTGVSLNFSTITGIGYTSVEKHAYPPYNINTPGVSLCTILPYRWVINNKGINSFSGKISFDLDMLPVHKHYSDIKLFWRESENNGNFTLLSTTYNSSTNRLEANITKFGEFFLAFSDVYEPSLLLPRAYMVNLPVDSVLIKWDVTTDLDKYIIQVSSDPNFGTLILDTANVFSNQIVLPQLRYYHDYYWRVKSYNETCESRWSFVRTFKTIIAPPDLVYPLNSAVEIDLKGTLRWMEVNGGYKYKLQVSGTPDFTVPLIDTIVTNITFFDYKDFQYGSKYYWRVAANSYGNYENWSKVWEFSTYFGKVSLSSPFDKQILIDRAGKLKWNHLANAISYRIQVSRDSLFGENIIDTLTSSVNELVYTGLDNSTTYYWRVLAYDSTTKSAWSDTWRFTTIFSAPQLRIPLNNSIKQSPDGYLKWLAVIGAEKYQVQLTDNPEFTSFIFNDDFYETTFHYKNLVFEKKYYWRVRAKSGEKTSEWSEIWAFTVQPEGMLISPAILYPQNNSFKVPVHACIKWLPAYLASGYDIELGRDISFNPPDFKFENVKFDSLVVDLPDNAQFYYLRIRSKNNQTNSDWSEPVIFTTALKTPEVIYPLDKDTSNAINFVFKWAPVDKAKYYYLQVAADRNFTDLVINQPLLNDTKFDFTDLLDGVYYYWHVAALNDDNASDWTPTGKLKILINLSADGKSEEMHSINVYPNPAVSEFTAYFTITKKTYTEIDVINSAGELMFVIDRGVFDSGEYQYQVNCSFLASGNYFIRFKSAVNSELFKFQVIK